MSTWDTALQTAIESLAAASDTVIGLVIGATFSLVGVGLQNRNQQTVAMIQTASAEAIAEQQGENLRVELQLRKAENLRDRQIAVAETLLALFAYWDKVTMYSWDSLPTGDQDPDYWINAQHHEAMSRLTDAKLILPKRVTDLAQQAIDRGRDALHAHKTNSYVNARTYLTETHRTDTLEIFYSYRIRHEDALQDYLMSFS